MTQFSPRQPGARWAALLLLLGLAAPLPTRAQMPTSDEPFALQGPFTWTQQRGQFGAVIQGELKLRVLPAAGTFTCFVQGQGKLAGELKAGPSVTRIDGTVTMAASSCSGTWNRATGALGGTAQLHVKTAGKTDVDIHMQGASQHHSQPIDADSTDALILSGQVVGHAGTGHASYVKGGAFDWRVTGDAGAPPPQDAPPAPAPPQSLLQKLGQALGQPPSAPPPPGTPPKKAHAPATKADVDKLAADKEKMKADLDQALQDQKAHKAFTDSLDESAAKGAVDGLKAALEHGASVLDEALKKNKWDENAPPGTASKVWSTLDKLNKLKDLISDIREVQSTMAGVDKDVKAGAYNENRGRMVKGTAVLGKTIKIVIDKLPIVGSAASEVVDKTFGTVVHLANERAKTGNRWDCCVADQASDCCCGD